MKNLDHKYIPLLSRTFWVAYALFAITLLFTSCELIEEEYCNMDCWTVINVKSTSIKIYQPCIDDAVRIYLPNPRQYVVNQVLCGDQVPL